MQPRRPERISDYSSLCLEALAEHGLGHKISVGGALGLLHYLDYRTTHDVDVWWESSASEEDRAEIIRVVEEALRPYGEIRRRSWGDVVSIELKVEGKKVFSFQIASRSVQLQQPKTAPWVDVLLDDVDDLIASKMVALVERGAPRDFRDVFTVCTEGLSTPNECWDLWRRRQQLSESDTDLERARLAVETHLERISQHRPLETITDPDQRASADKVRRWFREELLDAAVD